MVRPFPGGADLLGKRTAIRNNMIPRHPQGYRSNTMQEKLFNRLMDVIEYDVAPLTRKRVAIGCKVFGAAVLRKDDLSLVLAETNMEAFSPLWHGEVYAIKQFWELQGHPDPKDCIFIATHQPCCMCASAIAWSRLPELFYLFGYENTSKDFNIPRSEDDSGTVPLHQPGGGFQLLHKPPHHGPVRYAGSGGPFRAHQEPVCGTFRRISGWRKEDGAFIAACETHP